VFQPGPEIPTRDKRKLSHGGVLEEVKATKRNVRPALNSLIPDFEMNRLIMARAKRPLAPAVLFRALPGDELDGPAGSVMRIPLLMKNQKNVSSQ
jgi:hypothetical protein